MKRSPSRRQRGAVSVETALVIPLVVLVIIGGVHFGRVLMIRHKLAEATNYATRSAAIARDTDPGRIRALVENRMNGATGCDRIRVNSQQSRDPLGVQRLEVTTACDVNTGIGGALLGPVGPDELAVTVAMPF